ncbi:LPXTG cell wall anchor domain-containing protein [Halobacillus massiliensis]|uniref:LPXTG cell wall anchor domain-containing protein n=1 Tax=Halobacillus massiliensis TaxID=1926286 RepID=UPI0009E30468|nr:LPXTG cell wall anchor domain-containing protein [Halobacillus massiliensis]
MRDSIDYFSEEHGMDRANALAYLSAATDYEVSQVVDKTKGIHALIRKDDFKEVFKEAEEGGELPKTSTNYLNLLLLGLALAVAGKILLSLQMKRDS